MINWIWRSWGGRARRIVASEVRFEAAHVVFYGEAGQILLAIKNEDVGDLHPDDGNDPPWWS